MSQQPTVFFGPFIGEFGWELTWWHGWVRKVCMREFKDYRKIAASFPGRQPFYPCVDEFWELPQHFVNLRSSGHGYYTDAWRGGYPGRKTEIYTCASLFHNIVHLRRPREGTGRATTPYSRYRTACRNNACRVQIRAS